MQGIYDVYTNFRNLAGMIRGLALMSVLTNYDHWSYQSTAVSLSRSHKIPICMRQERQTSRFKGYVKNGNINGGSQWEENMPAIHTSTENTFASVNGQ